MMMKQLIYTSWSDVVDQSHHPERHRVAISMPVFDAAWVLGTVLWQDAVAAAAVFPDH
jgi:hypothetical protein